MKTRINWFFVIGTVCRTFCQFYLFSAAVGVVMIGFRSMPVGTEWEELRKQATFILAQQQDFGELQSALLIVGVAMMYAGDIFHEFVRGFRLIGGIKKKEFALMARCANMGISLSIANDEGYIAVGADGNRFRLWRMAAVEHFLQERENHASVSTTAVSADTHAHAGGVL